MIRYLAALALVLVAVPASSQGLDIGVGTSFVAFSDDDGVLQNVEALAATAQFELPLDGSGDNYVGLGIPVAADKDDLLWGVNVDFRRRLGKSDVFFIAGGALNFVPDKVMESFYTSNGVAESERGVAVYGGPRVALWAAIPIEEGTTEEEASFLPVEISGFLNWHVAGISDAVDTKPVLLGFAISFPNSILE